MTSKRTLAFLVIALAAAVTVAPAPARAEEGGLHDAFDQLLGKFVDRDRVDYAGFSGAEAELDAYLETLGTTDPESFSREEKLAFWINAYNAFTVKLILNHYPGIESIRDIPRGDRWKWDGWVVNGEKISLDDMEHKVLRPMGEPRMHFAINCASYSCPPLATRAYTGDDIETQLEEATVSFLADTTRGIRIADEKGTFGGTNHTAYISEIFHWFESDFKDASGSRISFIIPHTSGPVREYLEKYRYDLKIKKLKYDWSLNGG